MTLASVISSKCTRCGACLEECPTHAIVIGLKQFAIDSDLCDGHGNCIAICPERAITAGGSKQEGMVGNAKI